MSVERVIRDKEVEVLKLENGIKLWSKKRCKTRGSDQYGDYYGQYRILSGTVLLEQFIALNETFLKSGGQLVNRVEFESTTKGLRVPCSTTELPVHKLGKLYFYYTVNVISSKL